MEKQTELVLILKIIGALIVGIPASWTGIFFFLGDKPSNFAWLLDGAVAYGYVFGPSGLYIGFLFPSRWYVAALIGFIIPLYIPIPLVAGYLGSRVHIGLIALRSSKLKYVVYPLEFLIGIVPPMLVVFFWVFIGGTSQETRYLGLGSGNQAIVSSGQHPYYLAAPDPLQAAAEEGNLQEIERLVLQGHNINTRDLAGRTPLHYAVGSEQVEAVSLLLLHGADADIQDQEFGVTPLHWAVGSENLAIIRLLAPRMKNIDARNKSNESALDIAHEDANKEIIEILTAHGSSRENSLD